MDEAERDLERGVLTARGLDRVLRVAWTVADLVGHDRPGRDGRGPGSATAHRRRRAVCPMAIGASDMSVDDEPADGLLDRVLLTRVIEPGDEIGGRWVREFGRRGSGRDGCGSGAEPLPGVSGRSGGPGCWPGPGGPTPERDLAAARAARGAVRLPG